MAAAAPVQELTLRKVFARQIASFLSALDRIVSETIRREVYPLGSVALPTVGAVGQATGVLSDVIGETQALADLLGRRDTLQAAERAARTHGASLPPPAKPPIAVGGLDEPLPGGGGIARVPFNEAVGDVLAREPRLARGWREVQVAYNRDHVFAAARSAELEVTKRVQGAIAKAIKTGGTVGSTEKELMALVRRVGVETEPWQRWYAETVFRTNAATAYSAGRFRQMAEPAVAFAIGALRYTAVGDVDTRPNHAAADGLIASPDDPVWHRCAPPLGYNCRCGLDFVSWPELQRMGLVGKDGRVRPASVPRGAGPDPHFQHTGRPDVTLYGSLS